MPCTFTGSFEGDRALAAEEYAAELKKELDLTTRLLCSTMKILHNPSPYPEHAQTLRGDVLAIEGMTDWWEEHQKRDREKAVRRERYLRAKEARARRGTK
jgi:hypothetical protein